MIINHLTQKNKHTCVNISQIKMRLHVKNKQDWQEKTLVKDSKWNYVHQRLGPLDQQTDKYIYTLESVYVRRTIFATIYYTYL